MNSITLMGRLTADVELKTTQSGLEVCSFCIAVNRPVAKDAEKQADFINCVAWRQTAAFISNYFGKGDMIAVEGSLQSRKWTDKDGNNRTSHEVNIYRAHFCGSKKDKDNNAASQGGTDTSYKLSDNTESSFEDLGDDELPF